MPSRQCAWLIMNRNTSLSRFFHHARMMATLWVQGRVRALPPKLTSQTLIKQILGLKTKRVERFSRRSYRIGAHSPFAKHILAAPARRGGATLGLTMFISTVVSAIFDRNPPAFKTSAEASKRDSAKDALTCRRCKPRAFAAAARRTACAACS